MNKDVYLSILNGIMIDGLILPLIVSATTFSPLKMEVSINLDVCTRAHVYKAIKTAHKQTTTKCHDSMFRFLYETKKNRKKNGKNALWLNHVADFATLNALGYVSTERAFG